MSNSLKQGSVGIPDSPHIGILKVGPVEWRDLHIWSMRMAILRGIMVQKPVEWRDLYIWFLDMNTLLCIGRLRSLQKGTTIKIILSRWGALILQRDTGLRGITTRGWEEWRPVEPLEFHWGCMRGESLMYCREGKKPYRDTGPRGHILIE